MTFADMAKMVRLPLVVGALSETKRYSPSITPAIRRASVTELQQNSYLRGDKAQCAALSCPSCRTKSLCGCGDESSH
jgi:hypothetical protein